ncbi:MAG: translesion DNA synthesis-associated protein ImuA [Oceanococcaceae bacterium]
MGADSLADLLARRTIWRGSLPASLQGERTGHAALDRILPGRGWPTASLVEILLARPGIGELSLLATTLRHRRQSWVAPPHQPYAPALASLGLDLQHLLIINPPSAQDSLWACEQLLRAGTEQQVLCWQGAVDTTGLRRLQLAAEAGQSRLFLFRSPHTRAQASPAALRISLKPTASGLLIDVFKVRGGHPASCELARVDDGERLHFRSVVAGSARHIATADAGDAPAGRARLAV